MFTMLKKKNGFIQIKSFSTSESIFFTETCLASVLKKNDLEGESLFMSPYFSWNGNPISCVAQWASILLLVTRVVVCCLFFSHVKCINSS